MTEPTRQDFMPRQPFVTPEGEAYQREAERQLGVEVAARVARKSSLSTLSWYALNQACEPIWNAFGGTYLVGTAAAGGAYRDVDVRTILHDDDFDRLFSGNEELWALLCTTLGMRLTAATGLPIDYQIQRMTEANEKYPGGNRHPVGMVVAFAGGGDATRFSTPPTPCENEQEPRS